MTENLKYPLTANSTAIGSYNDGTTFTFNTGSKQSGDANAILNANSQTPYTVNGEYYYTWYAATAGKGGTAIEDVNGSICPARWRLPASYDFLPSLSLSELMRVYGISIDQPHITTAEELAILINAPISFTRVSYFYKGILYSADNMGGHYQGSTSITSNLATSIGFRENSRIHPKGTSLKYYGITIRCVALK